MRGYQNYFLGGFHSAIIEQLFVRLILCFLHLIWYHNILSLVAITKYLIAWYANYHRTSIYLSISTVLLIPLPFPIWWSTSHYDSLHYRPWRTSRRTVLWVVMHWLVCLIIFIRCWCCDYPRFRCHFFHFVSLPHFDE